MCASIRAMLNKLYPHLTNIVKTSNLFLFVPLTLLRPAALRLPSAAFLRH